LTVDDGSTQAALKVQELQRKLYRAAKAQPKRTFGILYDKVCSEMVVRTAFEQVRRNRGAAGVDGITVESIEASGVERFLTELREELRQETYRPMPVRRVFIPKADGKQRPLGIPRVKDRVAQAAVKLVIEPLFEASFRPNSFGFRPKRSAHQAIEAIRREVYRKEDVIDLDLKSYFDTIDQQILMQLVRRRVSDPRVLRLIKLWLRAGVMNDGAWEDSDLGTPQGGVISPLLANIYLHPLDLWWETKMQGTTLVRYADDMVVLCPKGSAERYMVELRKFLGRLKLLVNEEKTKLVSAWKGFDFLGVTFRKQRIPSRPHVAMCYAWPSRRSMQRIRDKVRTVVGDGLQSSLSEKIFRLNRVIRGWGVYFRSLNSALAFQKVDYYVWQTLTRWMRLRHEPRRWFAKGDPATLYRRVGLVTLRGAVRYAR
jgi:group II intron reverse transcriptase/maturase